MNSHMESEKIPLKILMIAPTPFFADRGTHIRILEEALALERRGHKVTIVTYHIGQDIPKELGSDIEVRRIRRLLFWYHKLEAGPDWQKIILDIMLIRKTFFVARTTRPDILHGHLHEGVLIGRMVQLALFWRKMRLVSDFHGSLTKEMISHQYLFGGLLRKVFQYIEYRINRLGDAALASSWSNAKDISEARGSEVKVIPDGARLFSPADASARKELREKYGVPLSAAVALYTGAFVANKGLEILVQAMPLALEGHPDLVFVLAGFPANELDVMMKKYSVNHDRIRIISPLSYFELGDILSLGDIAIDPKQAQVGQASGKMLQYMGASLPVVCFDTENNREYLGTGGIFAAEETPRALADAILLSVSRREEWSRIGSEHYHRAEMFGWGKTGKSLEKIYETLLDKNR